jgi:hypothetical protein
MTARQDFTIDAGRDYGLLVSLFEADQTTPLNLLDCQLEWAMTPVGGTKTLVSKSSADMTEIEVTSIGEGLLTIHVKQLDTQELGDLTCQHELLVTDASGTEATVMQGLVTILGSLIH